MSNINILYILYIYIYIIYIIYILLYLLVLYSNKDPRPQRGSTVSKRLSQLSVLYVSGIKLLASLFQVVGVADPRRFARTKLQKQHKILDENIFEGEHQMH